MQLTFGLGALKTGLLTPSSACWRPFACRTLLLRLTGAVLRGGPPSMPRSVLDKNIKMMLTYLHLWLTPGTA